MSFNDVLIKFKKGDYDPDTRLGRALVAQDAPLWVPPDLR